jgi:glutathione synthase/RimK-type ligase-like ATP-grasp enzyme
MTDNMLPEVFVLGRNKRRGFTTQVLTNALRDEGVAAYAVTPDHTPKFKQDRVKLLVNDGVGRLPDWYDHHRCKAKWLNVPWTVLTSANKLRMFRKLAARAVPTLRWTTDYGQACLWNDAGKYIVARHLTSSARGKGIEIVEPCTTMPEAPLYTELFTGKYVKEYRAFIVDGKVVDIVMKMRRREREYTPEQEIVRSWGNGWVFARNSWERRPRELELVTDVAERAADAMWLRYGAVDLFARRWKDRDPDVVVIETNTHIGLDGSTPAILARAIKEVCDES